MLTHAIRFTEEQIKDLRAFRKRYSPNEAPAILAGHFSNNIAIVEKIYYLDSCEKSPVYFEIDPILYYDTVMKMDKDGYDIVGIFHTHPGSAFFSGTDHMYMKIHPNPIVWTIMGSDKILSWVYIDYLTTNQVETEIV